MSFGDDTLHPDTARDAAIETELRALRAEVQRLRHGLDESVKLQSHYAGLLDAYDGGHRIQFADAEDWLRRLAMSSSERIEDAKRRSQG